MKDKKTTTSGLIAAAAILAVAMLNGDEQVYAAIVAALGLGTQAYFTKDKE